MIKDKDFDESFELRRVSNPAFSIARHRYNSIPDDELDEIANSISYTPNDKRALIRKLDRHLVLFVTFLYMLSFLDWSTPRPPGRSRLLPPLPPRLSSRPFRLLLRRSVPRRRGLLQRYFAYTDLDA